MEEIARTLPSGYELQRGPRAWLASRCDAASVLAQAGYGLHSDGEISTSTLAGRKPLLELFTRSGVLLVRRFSHGGLLRRVTGSRFADPVRPFRELRAATTLAEKGIRTPEVVAARAQRAPVFGWRLDLVTRRVADTVDLGRLLGLARRGEVARAELRRVVRAAGALVRSLHDLGCLHADLTPNNMLVERASLAQGEPRLWIVDLEGTRFVSPLGDVERRHNLRRLLRFVLRREEQHGQILTRSDYARFMRGYDPEGRQWKDDWIAIGRIHARNGLWHRIGWMLESLWRRDADPRESAARSAPVPGPRDRA